MLIPKSRPTIPCTILPTFCLTVFISSSWLIICTLRVRNGTRYQTTRCPVTHFRLSLLFPRSVAPLLGIAHARPADPHVVVLNEYGLPGRLPQLLEPPVTPTFQAGPLTLLGSAWLISERVLMKRLETLPPQIRTSEEASASIIKGRAWQPVCLHVSLGRKDQRGSPQQNRARKFCRSGRGCNECALNTSRKAMYLVWSRHNIDVRMLVKEQELSTVGPLEHPWISSSLICHTTPGKFEAAITITAASLLPLTGTPLWDNGFPKQGKSTVSPTNGLSRVETTAYSSPLFFSTGEAKYE